MFQPPTVPAIAAITISYIGGSRSSRPLDPRSSGPWLCGKLPGRYLPQSPAWENYQKIGAGEGIRTLDPNLGKVVLYP